MRSPRHILVTGGAGFIGSNYLLHCVSKHPETHFVNLDALTYAGNLENLQAVEHAENYTFEQGDITDVDRVRQLFNEYAFDAVVHFAAESHVDRSIADPTSFVRTNVDGTLVLLQVARQYWDDSTINGIFHHVSTDEVFGSLGATGQFTLDTPYAPRSPYAASKAAADHLVRAFGETYDFPFVITNTTNNYGPYQFPEKLIPLVISNVRAGKPIPIYGKGDNVRDWLFVTDHCVALDKVLRMGQPGATYLIGGSQEVSNLELVYALLDLYDEHAGNQAKSSRSLITFVTDRPGHDFRYALDSSITEKEMDWKPAHDLRTGLKATLEWYLNNESWLDNVLSEQYRTYYDAQYSDR
ncbi:MAG: dTDP-glucose 4,6-dehydratase [Bacteroidetes Order II. Incertae sedis bacterium]|nr:dTDP-glucose 4,6-dehydratase [Bacteroidetes Order II. bacterium]MBT4603899.1 dTDP-glucose 4,6-dehydratase [Bacteroidetes Order II. bacterium]MBT5251024.1 dTDP-glucose 4,6-dehydratase [Bacteroidetes Order II. bacterium]MBT6201039.1 dTDP-glucose 4,6-dehydratase [Bacteroidetes Order II. bacterium]MBT6425390.1 dTDP-glucose 4,6-dehydratase [Bacteroidetes Order II. bacterium]